ncbi:MAG: glycine/D-amino acid oxidase-like deaminating enzyme [Limisphaerales bacterium]|jgi:glycine/D-amino acid oxidase-like deaminating enzyme
MTHTELEMHTTNIDSTNFDIAIAGGGIAGAWLLRLLHERGYRVALFESHSFGADQTLASQGMIHGGLKYALAGTLNRASEAIAEMPDRWRACRAGSGEIDLSGMKVTSEQYYMFAEASTMGRLTGFFAAKALRGRIERISSKDWPTAFSGFDGVVYELNDFVVDTTSLLTTLTQNLESQCWQQHLDSSCVAKTAAGWQITTPEGPINADCLISCAGNGSATLLTELEVEGFNIQQRPLKQVSVRPLHNVELWAHCLTGVKSNEPRLTITSHYDQGLVWYMGGKLATDGVNRSDEEQIAHAKAELAACVPWLDWRDAEYAVHWVDRAEPAQSGGLKPDQAYAERQGNFVQCFPTKLALAPDLGDRVIALLDPPTRNEQTKIPGENQPLAESTQSVAMGHAPWQRS